MVHSKEERDAFTDAAKPLIKFLAENFHPHVKVIVDCDSAELLEVVNRSVNRNFIVH